MNAPSSDDHSLPPLREVIANHDLAAKKSLGQHFLLDLNITRKIARAAEASSDDLIIEIGPGPGGLTRALLESGAELIAIERDARCRPVLEEISAAFDGRLRMVEEDALRVDERDLTARRPVKIVSNLPYNISTELLIKWLRLNHLNTDRFWSKMTLMFQKEVADRILAPPGGKTYGRLSVISQAASRPRLGFDLPARAFTPPPKVASSIVVFEPIDEPLEILPRLERVTQAAFAQRRKMLRSSLKPLFGETLEAVLQTCAIEPTARAETLTVDNFLALAQILDD